MAVIGETIRNAIDRINRDLETLIELRGYYQDALTLDPKFIALCKQRIGQGHQKSTKLLDWRRPMKKLSWKPQRRGNTYCSPACGAGCSRERHQKMAQLGNEMRQSMREPGQWRAIVAENMHWYVFLEHIPTKGLLTVWPDCGRYHAMLSLNMPHVGDMEWTDSHKDFATPQKAVDYTLARVRRVMAAKNAVMDKLPK
jgi:hypothetical protein